VKVEKWAKNGEKGQNSQPLSPRTRQCPHDATSGGEEATDCRCRHHSESESSGRSLYNPWHHRFRTPMLVAAHGERSCRKRFRKFWPNQRRWGPAQRQTASPNDMKFRTRRLRGCPRPLVRLADFAAHAPNRYASVKSKTAKSSILNTENQSYTIDGIEMRARQTYINILSSLISTYRLSAHVSQKQIHFRRWTNWNFAEKSCEKFEFVLSVNLFHQLSK
jgi:hypothetical protein